MVIDITLTCCYKLESFFTYWWLELSVVLSVRDVVVVSDHCCLVVSNDELLLCWCQCTSNAEKHDLLSSDANHNSVMPSASCCVPAGHSDLGYASDGDCDSWSSQSLVRGESENSHSSGCCSPSSSSAPAAETGAPVIYSLLIYSDDPVL